MERSSRTVIGYTGVDRINFEDGRWLEWGFRLTTDARDKGYATEASVALLDAAARDYTGEILGIIHPENSASHSVMRRLGSSTGSARRSRARCETSTVGRSEAASMSCAYMNDCSGAPDMLA